MSTFDALVRPVAIIAVVVVAIALAISVSNNPLRTVVIVIDEKTGGITKIENNSSFTITNLSIGVVK